MHLAANEDGIPGAWVHVGPARTPGMIRIGVTTRGGVERLMTVDLATAREFRRYLSRALGEVEVAQLEAEDAAR